MPMEERAPSKRFRKFSTEVIEARRGGIDPGRSWSGRTNTIMMETISGASVTCACRIDRTCSCESVRPDRGDRDHPNC